MITIVTGNPRSGTSMTMNILNDGGITAIQDPKIHSDLNPNGSFETNVSTVDFTKADGKSIKVLGAQQLFNLPVGDYKIILPVRDPQQVVLSRIEAFKQKVIPPQISIDKQAEQVSKAYNFIRFVAEHRPDMTLLEVPFDEYYSKPAETVKKISDFVAVPFDKVEAVKAIDTTLYTVRTREDVINNLKPVDKGVVNNVEEVV